MTVGLAGQQYQKKRDFIQQSNQVFSAGGKLGNRYRQDWLQKVDWYSLVMTEKNEIELGIKKPTRLLFVKCNFPILKPVK